jgi:site-specific DNA-methyltransferase (adenine-specific)
MELMARYPDKYFELAIVDPPYGINVNISMGKRKTNPKSNHHKFAGGDTSIPDKSFFDELFRVSQNQIVFGGNYFTEFLPPSKCWFVWDKCFSEDVSFSQIEMAWTSFLSTSKMKAITGATNQNRIHPTEKPCELYKHLLHKYAKAGDKILDTHLGSGSIAIACHDYGFDLTACELDTDYYNAAMKRINNHTAQLKLF